MTAARSVLPARPARLARLPTHVVVFLLPAIAIYTLFMIYPLLDSLRLSLFGGSAGDAFAGLERYRTVLTNPIYSDRFWSALGHTFLFSAIHLVIQNPVGLLLAELLSRQRLRGRALYRTLIFLPTTISVVIVAFIWQLILSPLWGLTSIGVLGNADWALVALSLISVWQYIGLPMLLFYAVLIAVPNDLLDAARVDGASAWQTFRHVKLPLVLPTLGVISIITYIANFNAFELVYTAKGPLAGPNYGTDIMGTLFYREFFGYQSKLGSPEIGATIASITLFVILAGVFVYLRFWRRRVTTYEL
jgi:raffinose/stachyose/melibiose transport system permease protein